MAARVLLVGCDTAPTNAFRLLQPYLVERGGSAPAFLLNGFRSSPPSVEGLEQAVAGADAVLCGMSSPAANAALELAAARLAQACGKPFGFYSDTFGAYAREWFAPLRENAALVFIVSPAEKDAAQRAFPNATIVAAGNPVWAPYFAPADSTAARSKAGAGENDFFILAPGTKNPLVNTLTWASCIEAARSVRSAVVVLTQHPGDRTGPEHYAELLRLGPRLRVQIQFGTGKTDQVLPGADVVVNGISPRIHAIARRIPCIDFYGPLTQEWLAEETGHRKSYFAGSGAVVDVYDGSTTTLATAFEGIQDGSISLIAAQERLLCSFKPTETLGLMADALERL